MPYADGIDAECIQEAGIHMMHYTYPFITPIAMSTNQEDTEGQTLGSATFLRLRGATYLLTNEHVSRHMGASRLSFFQSGGQPAAAIVHPFQAIPGPIDAALSRIDHDLFEASGKHALEASSLDVRFQPSDGEVFFIHGYPGVQSRWSALFEGLLAKTFPYATDQIPLPAGYDPDLHFAKKRGHSTY